MNILIITIWAIGLIILEAAFIINKFKLDILILAEFNNYTNSSPGMKVYFAKAHVYILLGCRANIKGL